MKRDAVVVWMCGVVLMGCATHGTSPRGAQAGVTATAQGGKPAERPLREQVLSVERAFAKTMADRDFPGFSSFISDEAVFVSAPQPLRGKAQVLMGWKQFYGAPLAPFSWQPERVEVLDSGSLALSAGPVRNPAGKVVGNYTSIWRREAPGTWRIIFDIGTESCDCAAP